MGMKHLIPVLLIALSTTPVRADPAEVVEITATDSASGWRFNVTLAHGDTGWDDYADGWRVELADGTVIGERPLAHPHVEEQPFTRSTSGVMIPEGTEQVFIRARTNVDGWAETTTAFDLPG
ncbi:hypothetical protein Jann_0687 [Jannaschia sp. CCS1]|nr:hypothetical protein Jann_0687 [Jannaschia sp. CCS1]